MKILFCASNYPPTPGGVSSFSKGIVENLRLKGINVDVIYDSFRVAESLRQKDVNYYFNINIRFIKVLVRIIHVIVGYFKYKPDLIFCTTWKEHGFGAYLVKKIWDCNYVIQAHGSELLNLKEKKISLFFAKKILKKAKILIPNSNYTSGLLKNIISDVTKIKIFNPGIPEIKMIPSIKDNNSLIIFTVARLIKRKGIDFCIENLSQIEDLDWKLFIAGDGPEEKNLKELVLKYKIEHKVRFLGYLSFDQLSCYYSKSDIFVLTSISSTTVESFGIVYLEANSFELPVIASEVGGVSDAVIDGVTGFLIKERDAVDFKNKFRKLASDKEFRTKIGVQGKNWAKQFIWNSHINKLIDIIDC